MSIGQDTITIPARYSLALHIEEVGIIIATVTNSKDNPNRISEFNALLDARDEVTVRLTASNLLGDNESNRARGVSQEQLKLAIAQYLSSTQLRLGERSLTQPGSKEKIGSLRTHIDLNEKNSCSYEIRYRGNP